jgi:monoamine oxidase
MKDIAIVGAGVTGLYLATLLQEKYNVTMVEAKECVGGRILTQDGHDLGPSWVWEHQRHILTLLRSLDIKLFEQFSMGDALYEANGIVERFSAPPSPKSFRIDGGLDTLIQKLHAKLDKTKLHLCSKVDTLIDHDNTIEVRSQTKTLFADKVIIALPPRIALNINYKPDLASSTYETLQSIPTWMGHSRKVVLSYEKAFWREDNLSGFAFSHKGPCTEIHDASIAGEAALFGFIRSDVNREDIQEDVIAQMCRLFGSKANRYKNYYDKNWRQDTDIATIQDWHLREHPEYGHNCSTMNNKVHFLSTECSCEQGGYLDGAISAVEQFIKDM